MDGVLDADVRISFPEEDPLHPEANKQRITSSVYVKYSPLLDDPNAHLVSKIKQLVASSTTGLDYDNVTVILDRARFGDVQFGVVNPLEDEKTFANVWTVIVAEGSVQRFRAIFFTFIIILVVLMLAVAWLLWKLYPIADELGGFRALFRRKPLQLRSEDKKGENTADDEHLKGESSSSGKAGDGGVT
jgi:type III secretion protein J